MAAAIWNVRHRLGPWGVRGALGLLAGLAAASCAGTAGSEISASSPLRSALPIRPLSGERLALSGERLALDVWTPAQPVWPLDPPARHPDGVMPRPEQPMPPAPRSERARAELGPERRFMMAAGVALAPVVEQKVATLADAYFRCTGKELLVTSGTRDPERQAEAMHALFRHGADIVALYRHKEAAREIKDAYEQGLLAELPDAAVVDAIEAVIRAQIDRGIFISAHLRDGAVDIRNRDMSAAERRAFLAVVDEVGGIYALEESRPPHYHLEIE